MLSWVALIYFVLGSDDEDASDDMVKLCHLDVGYPRFANDKRILFNYVNQPTGSCLLHVEQFGIGVRRWCYSLLLFASDDPDFIPNKADFFRLFSVAAVTYKAWMIILLVVSQTMTSY